MHSAGVGGGLRAARLTQQDSAPGGSPPGADLTPFVPRLVPQWVTEAPNAKHRSIPGTLVFTDLSGFTAMSERLAALGKVGAEEMTQHLDATFTELVSVSGGLGGTMLKFGGDALLIFFWGDDHEVRAARAAVDMQATLDRIGLISTPAGDVRLQMSVGAHCGDVDFFLVGTSHRELIVTGAAATRTVEMESEASAGEIRLSPELADRLDPDLIERGQGSPKLVGLPTVPELFTSWPEWPPTVQAKRFVPQMLREHLASGVELLEHRQMVVAFVHLANLDELIVESGPEIASRHLEDLVAQIQSAFAAHSVGFVSTDVYDGGPKIICSSGAIKTFENDDERMLRALREIVDYPSAIDLRVGVNRGHGFCGYVGPPFRRTFAVIGDVVNTAARVMAKAGPGEILSTAAVTERSETLFELTELAAFVAKGKAEPLVAYRVGDIAGRRERGPGGHPLIGRDTELDLLTEALDQARERKGRFVEIRGEAGIGKSRLLGELLSRAGSIPGVLVSQERCGRYAAASPYFPFRALLGSLVGGNTIADLAQRVRATAPELEPYIPLLALPLGLVIEPTPEVEKLSDAARRDKLYEVLGELLDVLLSVPTIWIIEDAQWIDAASADLLRHLARQADRFSLVLCVTYRSENIEPFGPADDVLELGPLSDEAADEILQARSTTRLLPDELRRLRERGHGNPYYLAELANLISQQRDFEHLPDSLESMLAARVDGLPPADRLVLRQLAVLGSRFDRRVAEDVVEGLPEPGDERWERLAEFVDFSGQQWRFIQTLVRDTAREGLSFRERRDVHERAGNSIESHTEDPFAISELLSLHFHSAGTHDKALAYSNHAAEKAEQSYAFPEAATFYGRSVDAARELGNRSDFATSLTKLANAELAQGEYTKAGEHYGAGLDVKRELEDRKGIAATLNGLGRVAQAQGDYENASSKFRESLEILRDLPERDPSGIAWLLNNLGTVAWSQGNYEEARARFEESLGPRQEAGDRAGMAASLQNLGAVAFSVGELATARDRFEESLRVRRELDDKPGMSSVLLNLGVVSLMLGETAAARPYYEESLALAEEIGNRRGVANALNNLGVIAQQEKRYEEASRFYQDTIGVLKELGDLNGMSQAIHNLGEVAYEEGRLEDARRHCEESLAIRRELGERRGVAESLTYLGKIASDLGERENAAALQLEALALQLELGNKIGFAECLESVAGQAATLGEAALAASLLGAVDAILDESGSSHSWSLQKREWLEPELVERLGADQFSESMAAGREMSADDAMAAARAFLVGETAAT
ncbi:MAG TPA: tetratricopeptide repeat protein [Actinomycetota bacterium]|nr:tetratricopeptide repeat protein [Actinomycetota bacterium]